MNNRYEYAVIRYIPNIEREEFINVGLLMMCKRQKWIRVATHLDPIKIERLRDAHPLPEIERHLAAFTLTANGGASAGAIAQLPIEERFRWLTAVKSASLQTSRPHPGLTADLDTTFNTLFSALVL